MAFNWRKFPWTNLHDLNLDWIIQTVKTLEENLADALARMRTTAQNVVDSTISALLTGDGDFTVNKNGDVQITGNNVLMNGNNVQISGIGGLTIDRVGDIQITGSGDFTVNKTGDVNLTGNNVRITSGSNTQMIGGALISAGGQQLTLHNPNSKKSMTANYNSGVLTLTNNQDLAAGVAVYPINTPADGGGDNSSFAANVRYVKDAVAAVDGKLDTEIENRTSGDSAIQTALSTETENRKSGDAAIQTAIEHEIKPKLVRDFHVTGTDDQNGYLTGVAFADGYPKSSLDNLIAQNAEIRLVVETPGSSLYFNICRPWGNSYIGFSGIVQLVLGVASQIIGYNGTDFTVYGNNAT